MGHTGSVHETKPRCRVPLRRGDLHAQYLAENGLARPPTQPMPATSLAPVLVRGCLTREEDRRHAEDGRPRMRAASAPPAVLNLQPRTYFIPRANGTPYHHGGGARWPPAVEGAKRAHHIVDTNVGWGSRAELVDGLIEEPRRRDAAGPTFGMGDLAEKRREPLLGEKGRRRVEFEDRLAALLADSATASIGRYCRPPRAHEPAHSGQRGGSPGKHESPHSVPRGPVDDDERALMELTALRSHSTSSVRSAPDRLRFATTAVGTVDAPGRERSASVPFNRSGAATDPFKTGCGLRLSHSPGTTSTSARGPSARASTYREPSGWRAG
jgi:hypothetical protein